MPTLPFFFGKPVFKQLSGDMATPGSQMMASPGAAMTPQKDEMYELARAQKELLELTRQLLIAINTKVTFQKSVCVVSEAHAIVPL